MSDPREGAKRPIRAEGNWGSGDDRFRRQYLETGKTDPREGLRECPFCGGEAKVVYHEPPCGYGQTHVECFECGAEGGHQFGKESEAELRAAAEKGWNTRTDAAPLTDEQRRYLRAAVTHFKNHTDVRGHHWLAGFSVMVQRLSETEGSEK